MKKNRILSINTSIRFYNLLYDKFQFKVFWMNIAFILDQPAMTKPKNK